MPRISQSQASKDRNGLSRKGLSGPARRSSASAMLNMDRGAPTRTATHHSTIRTKMHNCEPKPPFPNEPNNARNRLNYMSLLWGGLATQCRIVFPVSDTGTSGGADPLVRSRPPGRLVRGVRFDSPGEKRVQGDPRGPGRGPGGPPHHLCRIPFSLKLCGIGSPTCAPIANRRKADLMVNPATVHRFPARMHKNAQQRTQTALPERTQTLPQL